jgi:hypothetical protein
MSLVAEAKRSMDPGEMDLPAPEPRVSVSDAIKIMQMNRTAGAGGRGGSGEPAFDDDGEAHEQQMEELRQRLMKKLNRLRERLIREEGYTVDEETGRAIPPGWIRDPDYVPKPRGG